MGDPALLVPPPHTVIFCHLRGSVQIPPESSTQAPERVNGSNVNEAVPTLDPRRQSAPGGHGLRVDVRTGPGAKGEDSSLAAGGWLLSGGGTDAPWGLATFSVEGWRTAWGRGHRPLEQEAGGPLSSYSSHPTA